jgi:hypothetical protein
LYFDCEVGDQDNKFDPHVYCRACSFKHNAWVNGKRRCMLFGVPMVWRVSINHSPDCYFSMLPRVQNSISIKKNQHLCIRIYHQQIGLRLMAMDLLFLKLRSILLCALMKMAVSSNSEVEQPLGSRDAEYLLSTSSSNHKITKG